MGQTVAVFFRMEPPFKSIRTALCSSRSSTASATVGSVKSWCHSPGGTWLATSVERGLSAVVDHLEEIVLGLAFKRSDAPVVEDEEIGLGELGEDLEVAPVRPGKREFEAEPGQPVVDGR